MLQGLLKYCLLFSKLVTFNCATYTTVKLSVSQRTEQESQLMEELAADRVLVLVDHARAMECDLKTAASLLPQDDDSNLCEED